MDLFDLLSKLDGNVDGNQVVDVAEFINDILKVVDVDLLEINEVNDMNDEHNAELKELNDKIAELEG